MPLDGTGQWVPAGSSVNPAVTITTISSTDWNTLLADLKTALSTAMFKDGQATPTSNIKLGGFKLTGLAAATTTGDGLRFEQVFPTLNTTGPVNETKTTVASATTPDIWTLIGNVVDYTGTVTATGFAAAPQAGARRTLVCAAAAPFTAGANMLIDGYASATTYTAAAGDTVDVIAVTTTQFRLKPRLANGNSFATWGSQVFTGSGTFTTPTNTVATSKFKFTVIGGGGGGAGSGASGASGGGGNAGATAVYYISGLTASLACSVTIGAAGAAPSVGANNGGAGGNSIVVVNAVTVTANGGTGGQASGSAAVANAAASATATNGTDNINGGQGAIGNPYLATAIPSGGQGGASTQGGGGAAGPAGNGGQAGAAHGSGGGGAGGDAASNFAGGAGKIGKVVVEWVL